MSDECFTCDETWPESKLKFVDTQLYADEETLVLEAIWLCPDCRNGVPKP